MHVLFVCLFFDCLASEPPSLFVYEESPPRGAEKIISCPCCLCHQRTGRVECPSEHSPHVWSKEMRREKQRRLDPPGARSSKQRPPFPGAEGKDTPPSATPRRTWMPGGVGPAEAPACSASGHSCLFSKPESETFLMAMSSSASVRVHFWRERAEQSAGG